MAGPNSDSPSGLPRSLINGDGSSFAGEIAELTALLGALPSDARDEYRNQNASDVAAHSAPRLLVVAGPGAGKSFLFLERIRQWLGAHSDSEVYVASFVRKLVLDLQADIDRQLEAVEGRRVTVSTLHQLARSLIEKGGGTQSQPMRRHIRVIAEPWDDVMWEDTLQFNVHLDPGAYSLRAMVEQLYKEELDTDPPWDAVRGNYAALCQFYNALGFADMIHLARIAVEEDSQLVEHTLWIIDEYQDFNRGEDKLVAAVTAAAEGVLLAGDDDQALYQQLKLSHPDIIISYYDDHDFANAMLPYCSRCSYHICQAASAFMSAHRINGAIDKVYLPLRVDDGAPRVRIVGTATPSGAVDYIKRFLAAHRTELEEHAGRMATGDETDPFLMILSPDRGARFYALHRADEALHALIEPWASAEVGHGFDYRRAATYYGAAGDARDNFSLRKVLYYENVLYEDVHRFVVEAMTRGCSLADVDSDIVRAAVSKCHEVSRLIDAPDMAGPDKVAALVGLVEVSDPDRLAAELLHDPIGTATTASEDELELALPTAGRMSPVELMPLVRSKGLSAQHVIIIGADDVNMARTSTLSFFVALTRARRSLHVIAAMKARGRAPHQFLADLPPEHCAYGWYTKTAGKIEPLASFAALVRKQEALTRARTRSAR